jgi:hypothetical protein
MAFSISAFALYHWQLMLKGQSCLMLLDVGTPKLFLVKKVEDNEGAHSLHLGMVYITALSQLQVPNGCGHALKGRPGLRTSIRRRSLCAHFDDRCPRMQGPLWYKVRHEVNWKLGQTGAQCDETCNGEFVSSVG